MQLMRRWILAAAAGVILLSSVGDANATDWGRFYHYPYSYFPQNFRKPFRSADFDTTRYGYPAYPQYMAFPPYFRKDLYYEYLNHRKPGNNWKHHHQGNHYILDVF